MNLTQPAATRTEPTPLAEKETFPKLQFHGFGDVTFTATDRPHGTNSFVIGALDLFVQSQLAEKVSVYGEIAIESSSKNEMAIDLERVFVRILGNDYLNADIGRFHSSVGYYNTAFHHGTWFQTAVGRPQILDFEDGGGIIPAHTVGISLTGEIPSGKANARYYVEVGNGRDYSGTTGAVPNVVDDNSYKTVNVGFTARPDAVPGLQVGAGAYLDWITSVPGTGRIQETMLHGHAVYKQSDWEFLSEGYLIRHKVVHGGRTDWTTAGFAQLGRKFGVWTPYARFAYLNAPQGDAVYAQLGDSGLHYTAGVGLRWDFCNLAAAKAQYDHNFEKGAQDLNQLSLQVAFTF